MPAAIERWLQQRWYGDVAPGLGLRALAGLYRGILAARSPAPVQRLGVPVVVVGNFTAGGTGKTPLVIALAGYFSARGWRPGIVSRGHGRQSSAPLRVDAATPAALCGDEPRLMFERTGLPVLVDRDRVAAARAAIAAGCNLVLADDGLQHRRLGRDVEIEVIDGDRRYGNGLLLPAGPLREAPRACDFRVLNQGVPRGDEWPMRLRLGDALPLEAGPPPQALAGFAGTPVHAVAGIGNPARFFAALRAAGLQLVEHPFADHHAFRIEDFAGLRGPILMTEKDAVKCRGLGLDDAWAVPVAAELPDAFFTALASKLERPDART
jgi:tetraacyldisaccharide 4'-kinase